MDKRNAVAQQLTDYAKNHTPRVIQNENGSHTTNQTSTKTIGPHGPTLLEDYEYQEIIAHFNRERVPERVVHAKGAGAFGYFEITHDISEYSCAKVFETIGTKTPVLMRFSQVSGEMGSADTVRDPRGFAIKFYTDEGVWDLVGNNTPIFFMRDPILFPSFIHTQKRNPVTHIKDWDAQWDWMSLRPESTHQYLFLYSDRGIPDGYRHMNGYGSNTFSLISSSGNFVYCKFHFLTNQGIQNLEPNAANELAGRDPDYAIRDLYNAIANENFPSWNAYVQIMDPNDAKNYDYSFDVTKIWPQKQFPLIPVGKLVLNQNPSNYFEQIEQSIFSVSNLVAGIGYSPDRMLQGRLMAYPDAHRYRVGVNAQQLPVNSPWKYNIVSNYNRDGKSVTDNQNGAPNYYPNSFNGPAQDPNIQKLQPRLKVTGVGDWYDLGDVDNFTQPRNFYQSVLKEDERARLVRNLVGDISRACERIQRNVVGVLMQVDAELGTRVRDGLNRVG